MSDSLSIAQARRLALSAQGFSRERPAQAGTRQLNGTLDRMATLQIDSVNVFARSHYLPLFSRLGAYDTATLDRLLFARTPRYVEYWAHVAAFVPVTDLPLFAFRMERMRAKYAGPGSWFQAHEEVVAWVRAELAARGPLRPADLERDAGRRRGGWWEWDEAKRALELLWLFGEVAIAGRRGFERRYGLAEHVLPAAVVGTRVPYPDALRELVRRAARACGVATAADVADYWRLTDRPGVLAALDELTQSGELSPVTVDGWDRAGRPVPAWRHNATAIPRRVAASAFLTPFDPTVWFRQRALRLFDLDYRIEIYTPAAKRRYGYYSLPVLVGERIVARVDLKADRASGRLLVQSAWWEHGRVPDALAPIAAELETAAAWQALTEISVSRWGDATDELAAQLRAPRHDNGPDALVAPADDEPAPDIGADPALGGVDG